jgi:hypothetical protein
MEVLIIDQTLSQILPIRWMFTSVAIVHNTHPTIISFPKK